MKNDFNSKGALVLTVADTKSLDSGIEIKKYTIGIIEECLEDSCIVNLEDGTVVELNKKYLVINLCDVMQKEVMYNIVNANKALYHIHGNDIPKVTGKKLYSNMVFNGKLFVPLMYKTAEKLYMAEEEFLESNLTIKIYDTYRPYKITRYLYDILLDLTDKYYDYLNLEINGHKYDQTDFLAANTSTHNYGIALDMTLVDLNTSKELEMQTKMHDLSVYSVTDYNNDNADMFAEVMKKHGFYPLESEWWHFQDNESKIEYMNYYIDDNGKIKEYN